MNDTAIAECQLCGGKWFHVHGPSMKPCEHCGGRLQCGADCSQAPEPIPNVSFENTDDAFIGKTMYLNGKLCTITKYEGQP